MGEGRAGESIVSRVLRPRSLTAIVIDQIRDLIVTGKLALGEQLSENALAEQLGVSRTPVREAFLRLTGEKLVDVRPQRGTFVFQCDATEVRDICELREVLETGALRAALKIDRDRLVKALRAQVDAAEPVLARGAAAYQPFDTAFHETLVRASGNRELIEAYARISGRIRALRFRLTTSRAQIEASQGDHREIVDAMESGSHDEAQEALSRHMYNSYRFFVETFGQGGAAYRESASAR